MYRQSSGCDRIGNAVAERLTVHMSADGPPLVRWKAGGARKSGASHLIGNLGGSLKSCGIWCGDSAGGHLRRSPLVTRRAWR
jgi:hypothetical protein